MIEAGHRFASRRRDGYIVGRFGVVAARNRQVSDVTDFSAELGHVQLEVADLERSAEFYTKFLGLSVSERMESRKGHMVLLSGGERHSEVTLRAAPEGDPAEREDGPPAGEGGPPSGAGSAFTAPFQVAFEVADREAFADLFFELRKAGIPTTAVDHGVRRAVYFRDPDGNALEAYWDTREEESGRGRWGGRSQLLAVSQILSEERVRELAERDEEAEPAGEGAGSADAEPEAREPAAEETEPTGDEGGDARHGR